MLRFGYNTNGFAHHTLDGCLEILAEQGYRGVALTLDVHHLDPFRLRPGEVEAVRARLEALGLACVVETGARFLLDSRTKHHPPLAHDERARRVAFLTRAATVAADLGAEALAMFSGLPVAGVPEGEQRARVAAATREVLDHALRCGVALGFEPEPGMVVSSLADFDALRAAVGDDLALTLDLGHVRCTETISIAEAIRRYADLLVNVHIEDIRGRTHEHLPFGQGDIVFPPVLAALAAVGYAGLVNVELSRSSHMAPEAARAALAFLRVAEGVG